MSHHYVEGIQLLDAFGLQAGQHVLFVHAHPDDESVASGTTIHQLQKQGVVVHVLIATDGTASTLGDPQVVKSGGRRAEAAGALEELGIPVPQQHFLGEKDGQLATTSSYKEMVTAIGKLIADYHCVALFTPGIGGFDGHADHKAVHQAAVEATQVAASPPAVWGLEREFTENSVSVAADPAVKLNAARHHATQYPKLASRAPIRAPGSALKSSERLMALHAPDKSLEPYYGLLYFAEHYHPYAILNGVRETDETI